MHGMVYYRETYERLEDARWCIRTIDIPDYGSIGTDSGSLRDSVLFGYGLRCRI